MQSKQLATDHFSKMADQIHVHVISSRANHIHFIHFGLILVYIRIAENISCFSPLASKSCMKPKAACILLNYMYVALLIIIMS